MANLPVQSLTALVQTIAAGIQGRAAVLCDFKEGSVLRAISESVAGVLLWMQGFILQVLTTTRAATSQGSDLDSFYADFYFYRLGNTYATGSVTYTRLSPSSSTPFIPVGATVLSNDGIQSFSVTADTSNPFYSSILGGFTLPAMVASITVLVTAVTPGAGGNVLAGAVTQMTTPITGVDNVVNTSQFTGGISSETDAAFRARFWAYIASLSEGTVAAIQYAIASLKLGMQSTVMENLTAAFVSQPGFLCITVDDGSGYPSSTVISQAAVVANSARAGSISVGVFAPVVLSANIAITIVTAPGYDHNNVIALVTAAITVFVNTLPLGNSLPYSQISSVVWSVQGVTNATVALNGTTFDLVATPRNVIKLKSLSIS
jgi:uncharacterized phage protein gp47/JayE